MMTLLARGGSPKVTCCSDDGSGRAGAGGGGKNKTMWSTVATVGGCYFAFRVAIALCLRGSSIVVLQTCQKTRRLGRLPELAPAPRGGKRRLGRMPDRVTNQAFAFFNMSACRSCKVIAVTSGCFSYVPVDLAMSATLGIKQTKGRAMQLENSLGWRR